MVVSRLRKQLLSLDLFRLPVIQFGCIWRQNRHLHRGKQTIWVTQILINQPSILGNYASGNQLQCIRCQLRYLASRTNSDLDYSKDLRAVHHTLERLSSVPNLMIPFAAWRPFSPSTALRNASCGSL